MRFCSMAVKYFSIIASNWFPLIACRRMRREMHISINRRLDVLPYLFASYAWGGSCIVAAKATWMQEFSDLFVSFSAHFWWRTAQDMCIDLSRA